MTTLSSTLAFLSLLAIASFSHAAPNFPHIADIQGKVKWTNKDGEEAKPKVKQVLIEKASLQTEAKSEVLIQIDAHRQLQLLENSHVVFPSISWETGETPVVILKSGSMRWKETPGKVYNIALRTDLFEFISPPGDFIFSYDPKKALAEVKAVTGTMEFSAMNAEESALVTAGQKVSFQGATESGEIVYDVLLKGKKIPRGKLGMVEALSADDKKLIEAPVKKVAAAKKKKAAQEAAIADAPKAPGDICDKPPAKFNECAWVCEGNPKNEKKVCRLEKPEVTCVRKRCNANGEWSEATPLSKEKAAGVCGVKPLVKACDY
jgi:hypothetical protein